MEKEIIRRDHDSVTAKPDPRGEGTIFAFSTYGWTYNSQWTKGIHKNGITKELNNPGTYRMIQAVSGKKTAIAENPWVIPGSEHPWVIPSEIVGNDKSQANKFAKKFDAECNRALSKYKVKAKGEIYVGEEWYKITPSEVLSIREKIWKKLTDKERGKEEERLRNLKPVELRGLQPELVQKTIDFLKSGGAKGKGIAPTGLGKTVMAWSIFTKAFNEGLIDQIGVMTAPSQFLCNKNSDAFVEYNKRNGITNIVNIPIFSGSDIGYHETVSDLNDRKGKLREKLLGFVDDKNIKIILHVCNNSMALMKDVLSSLAINSVDLLIADEAHTLASHRNTRSNSVGTIINFHLFDENIKIKHRLFFTATEKNLINPDFLTSDQRNAYMNNPEFFGTDIFRVSYGEAVVAGHIVPFTLKVFEYGDRQREVRELLNSGIGVFLNDLEILDENGELCKFDMKLIRSIISSLKIMQERKKLLILVNYNSHATLLEKIFLYLQEEQGKLKGVQINKIIASEYKDPAKRLDEMEIIDESEESHIVIAGPWAITGVDCPSIDSVLWCFTPGNEIRAFQGTGRGVRISEGKEDLLVCFNLDLD